MPRLLLWIFMFAVLAGCGQFYSTSFSGSGEEASTSEISQTPTWNPNIPTIPPIYQTSTAIYSQRKPTEPVIYSTRKPTSTSTPIITPTRPPIPPVADHTFQPDTYIFRFVNSCGDGGQCLLFRAYEKVLFGSGILMEIFPRNQIVRYAILDREEICEILYASEQTGFLEYDSTKYFTEGAGGGVTLISVNGWRSNIVQAENLRSSLEDPYSGYIASNHYLIYPVLRDIYFLLRDYEPENWQTYIPKRFVVSFALLEPEYYPNAVEWPLTSISLLELTGGSRFDFDERMVIQGSLAIEWSEKIVGEYLFKEDDLYVYVLYEPLLPGDYNNAEFVFGDPVSEPQLNTNEPISCSPADGVYPIPTPESP